MSLYSPRIKEYRMFGSIISNAGGVFVGTTSHPINGEVLKVKWDNHTTAAGGSLFIQVTSPFVETLGSIIATNSDKVQYLSTSIIDTTTRTFPIINDVITISGGGLGNVTSGDLIIYYR